MKQKHHIKQIKRIQYWIITISCITFFNFQAAKILQEYLAKEKGTTTKYMPITESKFPAITSCSKSPYDLEKLQQNGIGSLKGYRGDGIWVSNDTNVPPEQLYHKVVTNMNKALLKITIKVRFPVDGNLRFDFKPWDTPW